MNFDEKSSTSINPANFQGGLDCNNDTRKDGQRRRLLGVINQNLVEGRVCPLVNKRALSEKNVVYEKKQADPVHRPITRRFAAQNATTLKSSAEETKTVSTSSGFGECIYVDDEHKPVDQPVPMSLEQTESMQSEIDQVDLATKNNDMKYTVLTFSNVDSEAAAAKTESGAKKRRLERLPGFKFR